MITILDLHVTFESTRLSSTEIVETPGPTNHVHNPILLPLLQMVLHWRQNKTRTQKLLIDQCLALVQPQTLDILSLCRNVPKDWALRAPNFQGHPTASPATTARTAAKCHIRRPTAQHGGWSRFYCKNCGCDLQTRTKDKSGGVGAQLLTTMLDVGNLNSDSQPVQKRFLGGPRKEKLRSFPHVEPSLIILSAGPGDVQYFGGPPGWIGHD